MGPLSSKVPEGPFTISNANDSAILDLRIYQKYTSEGKKEEFLGGIQEFISGLLAQQGERAGFMSPCGLHESNRGPVAVTCKLDKLDQTPSRKIDGHIMFQVTSVLSDESPTLLQAGHAITGANKQLEDMKSRPAGFATVQHLVNSSSNAEAITLSAANPWLPLLKSLELFVAAVDAIAEVRVAFLTGLQCGCK